MLQRVFGRIWSPERGGGNFKGELWRGGGKFKGVPKSRFQLQMHFGQEIMLQVELDSSSLEQGGGKLQGEAVEGGEKYKGGKTWNTPLVVFDSGLYAGRHGRTRDGEPIRYHRLG